MLLDPLLSGYLSEIEHAVGELVDAYVELYEEEIITAERANFRIRIRMANEYLLELNEAVISETGHIKRLGYRYHFQDRYNNIVFRYDNTPHFPKLVSFPHHKHIKNQVIEIDPPSIPNVIREASELVKNKA
jgi:hypothetical protein